MSFGLNCAVLTGDTTTAALLLVSLGSGFPAGS
jgi:hypothetical protein